MLLPIRYLMCANNDRCAASVTRLGLRATISILLALFVGCEPIVPPTNPKVAVDEPDHTEAVPSNTPSEVPQPIITKSANSSSSSAPALPTPSESKGLIIKDVKIGTGLAVKEGAAVYVHYTGRLTNGTKFDSSLDRNEPFKFIVGRGKVIKGWDLGLVGMREGGKRHLTIISDLAYGDEGSPPNIPPKATLTFDIELLRVVP